MKVLLVVLKLLHAVSQLDITSMVKLMHAFLQLPLQTPTEIQSTMPA
jgi:hypothetical protein